ncbi:MAG: bifunctional adenosylcobinamide kinase/adenosylcobinamide-phosphate guanylyltransferase [Desulfonauticus sp.]|nr:bifunctional adenosylcobinamide kinase/adenosylcobinamide-phosphate guanylyltransferase [Desulfonauticus sp.]
MFELVLGGFSSGKSDFALSLLKGEKACLVVTGKALDFSFRKKILEHRKKRDNLLVIEAGEDLGMALKHCPQNLPEIVVEGLDFWYFSIQGLSYKQELLNSFWDQVKQEQRHLIFVSSEVTLGGVGTNRPLDQSQGLAEFNQQLAKICQKVYFLISGCPVLVKS